MGTILNNFINALGWSIFHSLWQGAAIYGILLIILALVPQMKSGAKHNLAYLALCLMFAGFCLTFYSLFSLPVHRSSPPLQTVFYSYSTSADPDPQQEISLQASRIFPLIVGMYVAGLVLQLFLLSRAYIKLTAIKRSALFEIPLAWSSSFEKLCEQLNLKKNVRFGLSSHINVPMAIGYVKPLILFPVALASQMDINHVEAILIHELSHIKRNDYILNLIKTGIEAMLFFNPFMWLCTRLIGIEREHVCDDLVLKLTNTPLNYAHALLKIEILKDKQKPALAMAATGSNQHLYQRIKRITDMKTNYINSKQKILTLALMIATMISLAWISSPVTVKASKPLDVVSSQRISTTNSTWETYKKPVRIQKLKPIVRDTDRNQDTTRKKKIKIITIDTNGIKKEYNSIREMPDSLKREVFENTSVNDFQFNISMDSLKQIKMLRLASLNLNKVIENARNQALSVEKSINSEEFKKNQAELQKKIQELSKRVVIVDADKIKAELEPIAGINKHIEEIKFQFDTKDWKQLEDLRKLESSPEYKRLKKNFEKDLERLKKKKGLKTDLD